MSVSIDQVRGWLRYDDQSQDDALSMLMAAAQEFIESRTGHLLTLREVTEQATLGPVVYLQKQPFQTDTLQIFNLGADLVEQELSDFVVRRDGRVLPRGDWPASQGATMIYRAGYASADDIPATLIHAMCLYCAMSDEERTDIASSSFAALRSVLGHYWRAVAA